MNESLRDRLRRLRREDLTRPPGHDELAQPLGRDEPAQPLGREVPARPLGRDESAPPSAAVSDAIASRVDEPQPDVHVADAAREADPAHGARSETAAVSGGARIDADRLPARTEFRAAATTASDLQRRLARRSALLGAVDATAPLPTVLELPRRVDVGPPERLAASRGGAQARVSSFERAHAHGAHALEHGLAHDRALLAASARDPRFADIDLERAVYLDTETTGLSGGAGTYVFLVGLGTFTSAGFEVWQGFLDHPGNERALLQETAERIADASAIVSFFGKSFDRHRLEDKMRIHGVAPPFATTPHLDLYWPLRRANQGRFENCRLKTLERELAGVVRDDDLPGSFAPAAWFDFLGNRPHWLEGVFRHNLEDVLSLVALLPHAAAAPIART